MKTKILSLTVIICFTLQINFSSAQNYKSIFGSTSTSWNVIPFGACDFVVSTMVDATHDTTIAANTYKIIKGLGGYLREDTIQGKVWFYDSAYNEEYLVMDLGLILGDTFDYINYDHSITHINVDSVYYESGLKRIRLNGGTHICGLYQQAIFTEGSGPSTSFRYQRRFNDYYVNSFMLCHFKDGVRVLGNHLFKDSCNVVEVGIAENKLPSNQITISPNPASDIITIESLSKVSTTIAIYTLQGKLLRQTPLRQAKTDINIADFDAGVYIIRVIGDDINMAKKIIKE